MTGPYTNPDPGNKLRCPQCGSLNAWCEENPREHWHICEDCGYTGIFRGCPDMTLHVHSPTNPTERKQA